MYYRYKRTGKTPLEDRVVIEECSDVKSLSILSPMIGVLPFKCPNPHSPPPTKKEGRLLRSTIVMNWRN